jgi:hypothetical protein
MLRKVIGCMALAAGVLLASSGSETAKRPRKRPTQVKLYLPNGDLYAAFDVETFEDQTIRKKARPAATVRVPVSGTMTTRYGLYGRWRAEVCWDVGSETSCHRELTFAIR